MTQAKKVLFTSHTANFAKFNQPYIKHLRNQGLQVDYAAANDEKIAGVDRYFKVDFARSPLRFDKHLRAYFQLVKLLETEKYALVHTHTPVGSVITRLAVKKVRGKKRRPAVIYTSHGFHFYRGAPVQNWLYYLPEKYLAKFTDAIVTINAEDFALAQKKFGAQKVAQINGVGVNLRKFKPVREKAQKLALRKELGLAKDDFVLVYVAELNKNKDQKFLIENAVELKAKIPKLQILFVGVGPERKKLEKLAKKLGVAENVRFLGYRRDVEKIYRAADVAVSASWREGLGLSLVEGMASGLPIVARENRGHQEIVASPQNGRLFETAMEFTDAIFELHDSPALRKEIGAHNVEAAKKFALEKSLAKMAEIYRKVL